MKKDEQYSNEMQSSGKVHDENKDIYIQSGKPWHIFLFTAFGLILLGFGIWVAEPYHKSIWISTSASLIIISLVNFISIKSNPRRTMRRAVQLLIIDVIVIPILALLSYFLAVYVAEDPMFGIVFCAGLGIIWLYMMLFHIYEYRKVIRYKNEKDN